MEISNRKLFSRGVIAIGVAVAVSGVPGEVFAADQPETAAAVAAARTEHGAAFVATPDYTTAALLGFAMGDRDVTSLSPKTDQFDFWFDAAAHAGDTAILFADDWRPLTPAVTSLFTQVTLLAERPVDRFGRPLDVHRIYLASGFRPDE